MKQNDLKPAVGSTHKKQRAGQGNSNGRGFHCGRGMKGAGGRTGHSYKASFEGGQTPLLVRMPKMRGFTNINTIRYQAINLDDLERNFSDGDTVDHVSLIEKGVLRKTYALVKLLGRGTVTKKLTVVVESISAGAKKAIESAGGTVKITLAAEETSAE